MNQQATTYFTALGILAGGIFAGFLVEKFLLKILRNAAGKTKWKGDDVIVHSLKGIIFAFGVIAGAFFASRQLDLGDSGQKIVHRMIYAAVVMCVTIWCARITVGFIRQKTAGTQRVLPSASIIANIVRVIIFLIGVIIILQAEGVSITPLLTALGVGGLAVALAMQDTLSNLFSGVQVIASRQVRTGDYVRLSSGEEGYVTDITWRNTTIRALPNNLVIVPNSKLASAIITNYYLPEKDMAVLVEVGVSYNSDLEKVERLTIDTAKWIVQNVQGGVKDFDPFIRYHTFADSSINFTVIMRGYEFTDQFLVKHEFIKLLHKRYRENNIEIPFPQRDVHLKTA